MMLSVLVQELKLHSLPEALSFVDSFFCLFVSLSACSFAHLFVRLFIHCFIHVEYN